MGDEPGPAGAAGKIFINYRRSDDPGFTQALYQRLEEAFIAENLFMDVEGLLKPGDDFARILNAQVAAADAMLVVIGPRWEQLLAARAKDKHDFVEIEITAALRYQKRIIPVLVGGANMPRSETLPLTLRDMLRFHAVELRPQRFKADCQGLIVGLKGQLAIAANERKARTDPERIHRALTNLRAPEPRYRAGAAKALGDIGPSAGEHISTLMDVYLEDSEEEVWSAAAEALERMGVGAIPVVADAIKNWTAWGMKRYKLIDVWSGVRPVTAQAVEGLFAIGRDREKYAEVALRAIGGFGEEAAGVIPTLMTFLGDDDITISIAAAWAITNIGPAAVPALTAALDGKNEVVADRAKTILNEIAGR